MTRPETAAERTARWRTVRLCLVAADKAEDQPGAASWRGIASDLVNYRRSGASWAQSGAAVAR